ncbi:cupin domain-containing protein [Ammoniphilus sp. CFH 90114]|uniref:cupin domain-containing protein n=1 Tax=Ammoniphilus sp. CFH 90114 TaxID=2493665 RepID=UPI00100FAA17|nr:cupin domain-containing protein [Ammoniphilus sp. CFH 90114]RXT07297.1 cupin domain-containing protein [Ammoniphilus sp. CFH 90114]
MHYLPPKNYSYPYYYYVNTPIHYSDYLAINHQVNNEQVEAIQAGIKREATALDFYSRLADAAPNQQHKTEILQALEVKKTHFSQFHNLYLSLTGRAPQYQFNTVNFKTYREGLQKAHDAGVEAYEEYRKNGMSSQNPLIQNVFIHASTGEKQNVTRLESLKRSSIKDYGSQPFVVDIEKVTKQNKTFRTALWTGKHLQLTLMSIGVGEDIGLESHPNLDQFLRIEEGEGLVQMGDSKSKLDYQQKVSADYAILVPAGKWHNLTNTGNIPIKLYSIYAPPQHPFGTVHETKAIAMAAEEDHDH